MGNVDATEFCKGKTLHVGTHGNIFQVKRVRDGKWFAVKVGLLQERPRLACRPMCLMAGYTGRCRNS